MLHIVFEGPDGSGKSTMAAMLAAELKRSGVVVHQVHQPGANKVATQIRKVFKGRWGKPCQMAQFHLAVADHFEFIDTLHHLRSFDISDPENSHACIQDRHSGVSGWAYQVVGSGISPDLWRMIYKGPEVASRHDPDYICLYLPKLETILKRITKRGEKRDHFEQTEFLKKVLHGYHQVPHEGAFPASKYIILSGEGTIEQEYKRLITELADRVENDALRPQDEQIGKLLSKLNVAYHMTNALKPPRVQAPKKKD